MSSIIDSFKEVFEDRLSFIKIVAFTLPLFYCYEVYSATKLVSQNILVILAITIFLLYGFLIEVTHNVINEKDMVMPQLNPLKIAYSSIKGIIAVGPSFAIAYLLANYLSMTINTGTWIDYALKTLVWLVCASMFIMSYLLFTRNKNILDIFDFKAASDRFGDLIVMILVFVLQLILINIPSTLFIGYTLFILFGWGPLLTFFLTYAIVFNVAATGHYLAQTQYEIIAHAKNNKEK